MPLHKRCATTAGCLAYIIEQTVNRGVASQHLQAFNSPIKKDRFELLVSPLEGETVNATGSRFRCERKQRFYLRYQTLVRVIRVTQRWRCLALLSAGVDWRGLQDGEVSLFVCPALPQSIIFQQELASFTVDIPQSEGWLLIVFRWSAGCHISFTCTQVVPNDKFELTTK